MTGWCWAAGARMLLLVVILAVISGRAPAFEPDTVWAGEPGHCQRDSSRYFIPERPLTLHIQGWTDDRPFERFLFDSTLTPGDRFDVFHGKPDWEPWTYEVWTADPSGNQSCHKKTAHGIFPVGVTPTETPPPPPRNPERIPYWPRKDCKLYDVEGRRTPAAFVPGVFFEECPTGTRKVSVVR